MKSLEDYGFTKVYEDSESCFVLENPEKTELLVFDKADKDYRIINGWGDVDNSPIEPELKAAIEKKCKELFGE